MADVRRQLNRCFPWFDREPLTPLTKKLTIFIPLSYDLIITQINAPRQPFWIFHFNDYSSKNKITPPCHSSPLGRSWLSGWFVIQNSR